MGDGEIKLWRSGYRRRNEIESYVRLSGLTKQDYILKRLTNKSILVQGNPRVYKALNGELGKVYEELLRLESTDDVSEELLSLIAMMARIIEGMNSD